MTLKDLKILERNNLYEDISSKTKTLELPRKTYRGKFRILLNLLIKYAKIVNGG